MRNVYDSVGGFSESILIAISLIVLAAITCKRCSAIGIRRQQPDPVAEQAAEPNLISTDPNMTGTAAPSPWPHPRSEERLKERKHMVDSMERLYGLHDRKVLAAMRGVPRHWFVPADRQARAYYDSPLPIGEGQTISQPYIVAYMTSVLELDKTKKVLEIGTGSGYQAAVLTEYTPHVYTIEIVEKLGQAAKKVLAERGYSTVRVKIGDGYKGWPEYAPFDAIIVTCAPDHIPPALLEQLKVGGRMVIPIGGIYRVQDLILVTKGADGTLHKESKMPVRFVPLTRDRDKDQ